MFLFFPDFAVITAVTPELYSTIQGLLSFESLQNFSLGGGTSLALRYNHRQSLDIDLFSSELIGKKGFNKIITEAIAKYGENATQFDFPCDIDDQLIFLRFFIQKEDLSIKVEVLQNFKTLFDSEQVNGLRLVSEKDLGLLKLTCAAERQCKKDIYDLDQITDRISIIELFELLKEKEEKYNLESDLTIFDGPSPIQQPESLIEFDDPYVGDERRPIHSNDHLNLMEDAKPWRKARSSWIKKMRQIFNHLNRDYPSPKGFDVR